MPQAAVGPLALFRARAAAACKGKVVPRRSLMISAAALLTVLGLVTIFDRPPASPQPAGALGRTSTLRVSSTSPPATVWVDGARRGNTPAELRLAPGCHQVVLVAPAADRTNGEYVSRRESVDLAVGATREIRVDLRREAKALDTSSTSNPANSGSWSRVRRWPVIAVSAHLLPNGKVLSWEEGEARFNPRAREITGFAEASLWDPATDTFTDVRNSTTNVFAGGHAFLADGRLLVTGGQSIRNLQFPRGTPHTNVFDYRRNRWQRVQNMRAGRWYPTATTLANGEVLTVGGNNDQGASNRDVQVWKTTGGWRYLRKRRMGLYPGMFQAPNGEVFYAGPRPQTAFLNPATGAWRDGPYNRFIRPDNIKTVPSVMYDGVVLTVGGGNVGAKGVFAAASEAESVDLNEPAPRWRRAAPMANPRRHDNATLLPDRTVLVTGGQREGYNEHPIKHAGVRPAELYEPSNDRWSTLSSLEVPRGYHSTATLLPDGRVLVAGTGNGAAEDQYNAQIFSPPYLYNGPRPELASAPEKVGYGQRFSVETPDSSRIVNVRLIRLGSTTHSFDMNTRLTTLGFSAARDELSVTAPPSGRVAPPGQYMLFVLNRQGVPSVARIISVGDAAGR
jgi:galactose oxidase